MLNINLDLGAKDIVTKLARLFGLSQAKIISQSEGILNSLIDWGSDAIVNDDPEAKFRLSGVYESSKQDPRDISDRVNKFIDNNHQEWGPNLNSALKFKGSFNDFFKIDESGYVRSEYNYDESVKKFIVILNDFVDLIEKIGANKSTIKKIKSKVSNFENQKKS